MIKLIISLSIWRTKLHPRRHTKNMIKNRGWFCIEHSQRRMEVIQIERYLDIPALPRLFHVFGVLPTKGIRYLSTTFLQPFFQRSEISPQRSCLHLSVTRHNLKNEGPRLASSQSHHLPAKWKISMRKISKFSVALQRFLCSTKF